MSINYSELNTDPKNVLTCTKCQNLFDLMEPESFHPCDLNLEASDYNCAFRLDPSNCISCVPGFYLVEGVCREA